MSWLDTNSCIFSSWFFPISPLSFHQFPHFPSPSSFHLHQDCGFQKIHVYQVPAGCFPMQCNAFLLHLSTNLSIFHLSLLHPLEECPTLLICIKNCIMKNCISSNSLFFNTFLLHVSTNLSIFHLSLSPAISTSQSHLSASRP